MGPRKPITRRKGLLLLLLSSGIAIAWGSLLAATLPIRMADFKAVYFGARSVMQQSDPYKESEFLRVYRAEGGEIPSDPVQSRMFLRAVPVCINLPAALFLVAPFALLPWGPAHVLWAILIAASFFLAALLVWNLGEKYSSRASLLLICILLANCVSIFLVGDTAGIVVSFCVIAVWCFLQERFAMAGILCLAISLAIKPHDCGLVWLYFLLAGGVHRKRALQTLAVTLLMSLASVLWVSQASPHWLPELRANLAATSEHGDIGDPGPDSITSRTAGMVIDLQAAVSIFRDDPHFYNLVSYLVCGALLLVWGLKTLRSRSSPARDWLALAAVVPLTMLVIYHRPHDAKLLLLTVPACVMLWAEGGRIGRLALLINTAAVILTADIPLALLILLANHFHVGTTGLAGKILTVMLTRPASLILLVMAIFYLWAYVQHKPDRAAIAEPGQSAAGPLAPNAT